MAATSGVRPAASVGEQLANFSRGRARLIFVEQRIVWMVRKSDGGGFLPLQADNSFQPRTKQSEFVRLPRFLPDALGLRRDAGQLLHQILGQFGGPVVGATNLADIRGRFRFRIGDDRASFNAGKQLADVGIGQHFVAEPGQQRHLFGAVLRPATWHVGAFIPAEQAGARIQDAGVTDAADQVGVIILAGHSEMIWRMSNV